MTPFCVVVDIETGGLDPLRHPIIQLAAVAVSREWEPIASLETKIQFRHEQADPEALRMNSYSVEEWAAHAVPPAQAARAFGDFLRAHASVTMIAKSSGRPFSVARLAGHNVATFDLPFIRAWWEGIGMGFFPATFIPLDTLQLAVWRYVDREDHERPPNFKLDVLCAHLGIERSKSHDALADALDTAKLAKALLAGTV